jgi:hypothetical protein
MKDVFSAFLADYFTQRPPMILLLGLCFLKMPVSDAMGCLSHAGVSALGIVFSLVSTKEIIELNITDYG